MVSRRTILGSAGVGLGTALAGCIASMTGSESQQSYQVAAEVSQTAEEIPIDLTVKVVDEVVSPGNPARLVFTLTNTAESLAKVHSGPPQPFGVLTASPPGETQPELVLWTDRYNDPKYAEFVITNGKSARDGPEDIGGGFKIPAGEDKYFLYELYTETPNLQAGTFVRDLREQVFSVGLFLPNEDYPFGYTLRLTIQEKQEEDS